jgi:P4 family phage/plasmid primase-like protien
MHFESESSQSQATSLVEQNFHLAVEAYLSNDRGLPLEGQRLLEIRWISLAEAIEQRFEPTLTSPWGGILFPNIGGVPTLRNWYPNGDKDQEKHLLMIKDRYSDYNEKKVPKYLRPSKSKGFRGFYDPYRVLRQHDLSLPELEVILATEDVIGCAKAALRGVRILGSPGVWCGFVDGMNQDATHPMSGKFPAYLADSDALTKPGVMHALISNGFDLDCKVGFFPSPQGAKVGLDEWLDSLGDLDLSSALSFLIVTYAQPVEKFVRDALPRAKEAIAKSDLPTHQHPIRLDEVYRFALRALTQHLPSARVLVQTFGDLFKGLGYTQKELRDEFASARRELSAPPDPGRLAQALMESEEFQNLRYDFQSSQWYQYRDCFWQPIPNASEIKAEVSTEVLKRLGGIVARYQTISDTYQIIRDTLGESGFSPRAGYLPFLNCVVSIDDLTDILPQNPCHDFRFVLPREFNPDSSTKTPGIDEFLNALTNGNQTLIELIKCFASALLRGQTHHQVYLQLLGDAGSGKGTLTQLLTALIGESNRVSCNLRQLCTGRFESARIVGKRLVIFDDTDPHAGDVQAFLSLTGGAAMEAERKGVDSFSFQPEALVVMTANKPPFLQSHDGLKRRTRVVNCHKPVNRRSDPHLLRKLVMELEAFTLQLLRDFDDERITRSLGGQAQQTLAFFNQICQTDGVADWAAQHLVIDKAGTLIKGSGLGDVSSAYGSYHQHCLDSGKRPQACNQFQSSLKSIFRNTLGVDVSEDRRGVERKRVLVGVRFRTDTDPWLEDQLAASEESQAETLQQEASMIENDRLFHERIDNWYDWSDKRTKLSSLLHRYPEHFNTDLTAKVLTEPDNWQRVKYVDRKDGTLQAIIDPRDAGFNLKLICDPNLLREPITNLADEPSW